MVTGDAGQGVMPQDYHPIADKLSDAQLKDKLTKTISEKKHFSESHLTMSS